MEDLFYLIKKTFLPNITFQRSPIKNYFPDKRINRRSTCLSIETFEPLFQSNILSHMMTPHTSDITQVLNLGILSIAKSAQRRVQPPEFVSKQTEQLMKILLTFHAMETPSNIIIDLKQIEIITIWQQEHNSLISTADMKETRAFRWFFDEKLSREIQNSQDYMYLLPHLHPSSQSVF